MTDRNVFEALYFNHVNKSPVIDLTDDIEESDSDEVIYPDSFSSSVGKMLNEKNISAVLCNVEVFYKSQIEYLEDSRYDNQLPIIDNTFINNISDDFIINDNYEKKDSNISLLSSKHSFSSYYFIKQTFNCPTVLIDRLINTMSDMNIDTEFVDDIECPKRIEIDAAFDTDKSNIITKKDLRFLNHYRHSKPKKARSSHVGKTPKIKQLPDIEPKTEILDIQHNNPIPASFEIIEISDSDEENELVNGNSFNEYQELAGY